MKNLKLLSIVVLCFLVTSAFAVIPAFSSQPPIDTGTYLVGTIGQPARLDPGRAYDTASGELIQNVYQPLIWFGDKHVIDTAGGVLNGADDNNYNYNMTPADHSDLSYPSGYVPIIAEALPTIVNSDIEALPGIWGQYWTFALNTTAKFQPWIDHNGVTQGRAAVSVDDVIYSFQVQMVVDSPYAPVWMFETPAFNFMTFDAMPGGFDEGTVANMIQQWCFHNISDPNPNTVTFNFSYPLPLSAMAQIFSQTWGSIVNKDFFIQHGCWNYSWYAGWSDDYRRAPDGSGNRTPIDRYYPAKSLYNSSTAIVGEDIPDMCGTGPYKYTFGAWDVINKVWRLDADPGYWMQWGHAGDKSGNYIHTIIEKGIDTWPTRKMLFLDGEFDVAVVPRANMYDLLQGSNKYKPLSGLTLVTNITELVNEEIFFCFNVSGDSAYQSYFGYPAHVTDAMPYFFNDTAIRMAFADALDYTSVINQAWFGEALQQNSWWVDGLVPASSKNSSIAFRTQNLGKMEADLKAAAPVNASGYVNGAGTLYDIWTYGFETTMIYNTGNDQRMIELQSIAAAFATLGIRFKCNVIGLDWPVFLDNMNGMDMPVFCLGWLADYADPSDWAAPYQQSAGSFLYTQGPPFPADQAAVDAEITDAAIQPDPVIRDHEYQDLQYKYYMDVPSIPVVQPIGRRFARDWVQGWYYNDLLPGLYAYDLYKTAPVSYTQINLDITHTMTMETPPESPFTIAYIGMGNMMVYGGGGDTFNLTWDITVNLTGNVPFLFAEVGLQRFNLTSLQLPTPDIAHFSFQGPPWASPGGPGYYRQYNKSTGGENRYFVPVQSPAYPSSMIITVYNTTKATATITWHENGTSIALPGNCTWEMAGLAAVAPGYSPYNVTNPSLSYVDSGFNCTGYTNTVEVAHGSSTYDLYWVIPGDINHDGTVDILDAILLSGAFLTNFGEPGYLKAADLDNSGTIDISDAIILSGSFGTWANIAPS
jgi:peptide/nickel transport system substrate-binding protein